MIVNDEKIIILCSFLKCAHWTVVQHTVFFFKLSRMRVDKHIKLISLLSDLFEAEGFGNLNFSVQI